MTQHGQNHVVVAGDATVPLLFTCEHAANGLPELYGTLGLDPEDLDTHWAFDPGILGVFEAAQAAVRCKGVRSRLSRLLVDVNREPSHSHFARVSIGTGFDDDPFRPVPGNQDLTVKERLHRLSTYYRTYHDVVNAVGDQLIAVHGEHVLVVGFHSFTPTFGNEDRNFEIGLLFDDDGRAARTMADLLEAAGLRVRMNEPYSGLRGENFSPRIHAHTLGCRHLEIEVNQGYVAGDPAHQQEVGVALADALRHLLTHW